MSTSHINEVADFCIEGRFLDFVIKDGYKLKGLLLGTSEGECYVKLAKHLRAAFDLRLPLGTWLQVVGTKKYDLQSGKVTLKAERVMAARRDWEGGRVGEWESRKLSPQYPNPMTPSQEASSVNDVKPKSAKTKASILVCQKSDCMKRGGKAVCQALEAALSDRGLEDQVTIKGTGCMKNCKAGPNLVMPDKTRYSRIQAPQVSAIMDKHFADKSQDVAINMATLAETTS
ncbi:NADH:ubiquinone oxidoreductase 24 kD subunit [Cylindrospermum stagnale PCC 7417]|uniref:NADH:ubiquinone oxidoreductase 24 kD subunit n=1 Tax=Cylindrospermum stagnale PCC 7417 TaxID=56107 RepID=K9X4W9_9NOST|nr:(2Fe-2S) ferredoxin domain-containing protein [Cylindrospermum stagnale]AFZ27144.1 NADH:ubiquinone oxidoreductase 24 kD subunit [Cylindrospermum stagnale PCC 7417]